MAGQGSITLTYDMLGGNTAEYGGAISNYAAMTISSTTMSVNGAAYGGGVQNAGTLSMTNTTVGDNLGGDAGGGVYNEGKLTAVNVTIAENDVNLGGSGGGLEAAAGVAALYNTIVAANTVGQGLTAVASDITTQGSGTISASSSYNLIGTGGSGGLVNDENGNLVGVSSPELASGLANNGGQNPTIALEGGSPAIDAGSASIPGVVVPTVDQRGGVARFGRTECRSESRHRVIRGELVVPGHHEH